MKIVKARITEMPKSLFDRMPKVFATLEDGTEHEVFEYYPDEISFRADEFVGLTLSQARRLKTDKDIKYLKS